MTSRLFDRFEPRFVLAHLKDVSPTALPRERRSSALASSHSLPYLEFLRARRPDLDLIAEHMPLEHVPAVRRRLDELVSTAEDRTASPIS